MSEKITRLEFYLINRLWKIYVGSFSWCESFGFIVAAAHGLLYTLSENCGIGG